MNRSTGRPILHLSEVQEAVILRNRIKAIYEAAKDAAADTAEIEARFIERAATSRHYPASWILEEIRKFNQVYSLLFHGEGISIEKVNEARQQ